MLIIIYKSKKLERVCTHYSLAKKQYGERMTVRIHQRIAEINSADSVEMLVKFSIGRCHSLAGNRKNEYAMDLIYPYRLVFMPSATDTAVVRIISIEDYH